MRKTLMALAAAATATFAARFVFAWASFVDSDSAAVEFAVVQRLDSFVGLGVVFEFNETKTA